MEGKEGKGVVYIGMDLGTFKTSVASSAGVRDVIPTAVGWPKDRVARTLLGRDVVFGKDLAEHRLAINVVRPFEKGVLKYNSPDQAGVASNLMDQHKQAARLVVEYAVTLTRPPKGVPIYGVIGAPSRATVLNKKVLLEAAQPFELGPTFEEEQKLKEEALRQQEEALLRHIFEENVRLREDISGLAGAEPDAGAGAAAADSEDVELVGETAEELQSAGA